MRPIIDVKNLNQLLPYLKNNAANIYLKTEIGPVILQTDYKFNHLISFRGQLQFALSWAGHDQTKQTHTALPTRSLKKMASFTSMLPFPCLLKSMWSHQLIPHTRPSQCIHTPPQQDDISQTFQSFASFQKDLQL